MSYRAHLAGVIAAGLLTVSCASNRADSKKQPMAAQASPQEMMAMMEKAGAPGAEHAKIVRMAGRFAAEVTYRMGPDAPEQKSKGEERTQPVLGGRFLHGDYTGEMMGKPFKGMSLVGYDNMKKKYILFWADDMSTGVMSMEGTADASGKVITYKGKAPCPAAGGEVKSFRQVVTLTDDDHYTVDMYGPGPDGKEMRGMHIQYTRVK